MKDNRKNNFKIGVNGLLILCGGIFFYYILFHSDKLSALVKGFFSVMTPITAGLVIAYILNPIMRFIETKLLTPAWNKIKKQKDHTYSKEAKVIRYTSVFITMIVFFAIIYALFMLLIPQLVANIQSILGRIPVYFATLNDYYSKILTRFPDLDNLLQEYNENVTQWFYNKILPFFEELISKTSTSLVGSVITLFRGVVNFIIGVIISIYLLADKEKFAAQCKKVFYAFLKKDTANNFLNNLRYSDKMFGGFITGKLIDSIIVGIICYIGMLIMNLPYSVLISVIVGITNIIPYFGPFIGAIPSAFFILMVDPKKCLIFIIFILILQQFDGNILGPKILSYSTGLNSFWIIFALIVFSAIFGVVGMFIGVPVFAVIYSAFRTLINKRLALKHMPVDTQYYIDYDFDPGSNDNERNSGKDFRFADKTFSKVSEEPYEDDAGSGTDTK